MHPVFGDKVLKMILRNQEIIALRKKGHTLAEIGAMFLNPNTGKPLSRARIMQICMMKLPLTVPQRSFIGFRKRVVLSPRKAQCKECKQFFMYTTKYPYRCPDCGGFRWQVKRQSKIKMKAKIIQQSQENSYECESEIKEEG